MSGWNYRLGMSNNAVFAYARGVKPLSRITLGDLREAGWLETKALAIWLAKSDHAIWDSCEWHHSSKYGNVVDFFDPLLLVEAWEELDREDHEFLKNEYHHD